MSNIQPIAYLWTIQYPDGTFGYKLALTKDELELGMEPDEVRDIEPLMLVITHESMARRYKKLLNNAYDARKLDEWKDTQWGA